MTTTPTLTEFPIDTVVDHHRERINPEWDVQPFAVEAWFIGEDQPAFQVWIPTGTENLEIRDAMLYAADITCQSIAPDYLVLTYDTHMTSQMTSPATGKPWAAHEMQNLCDNEGLCDTGLIRDDLVVMIARRSDQKIYMHNLPYHVVGDAVHRFEESHMCEWDRDDDARFEGNIPDSIRESLAHPPLTDKLKEMFGVSTEDFDLSPEATRMHLIMATIRILMAAGLSEGDPMMFQCIVPAVTEVQKRILDESSARAGLAMETL